MFFENICWKAKGLSFGDLLPPIIRFAEPKKLTWHSNLVSDLEICRKDPGFI